MYDFGWLTVWATVSKTFQQPIGQTARSKLDVLKKVNNCQKQCLTLEFVAIMATSRRIAAI
jgi:hypothetical protein